MLLTNTGWRAGGNTAPRPWIGPDSGEVYATTHPSTTAGQPADFYGPSPKLQAVPDRVA